MKFKLEIYHVRFVIVVSLQTIDEKEAVAQCKGIEKSIQSTLF